MAVVDTLVGDYLRALASSAAVPGGGSAAAVSGAMGTALLSKVSKLSARKAARPPDQETLLALGRELDQLTEQLARLSQDDIEAYRAVVEARKAAREQAGSHDTVVAAIERATSVPLETATLAGRGLHLAERLAPLVWEMVSSDSETGRQLLRTGLRGAMANVAINLADLDGPARSRLQRQSEDLANRYRAELA